MLNRLKKQVEADFRFGIRLVDLGLPQLMQNAFYMQGHLIDQFQPQLIHVLKMAIEGSRHETYMTSNLTQADATKRTSRRA